jgi:4-hydroxyphenylpyruvate dioxygenase
MYSSIATVCLSGSFEEKVQAIADAGFEGIEIFENDLTTYNGTAEQAGQWIRDLGLKLVTLQPFRDFEGLEGKDRQKAFDRAEHKFDLMEQLGTDLLMICSSVNPKALPGVSRAADDFAELGERAAKRGLRVAFEALAWGRHINDYRDSWEVIRRANHPAVGLVLDTFHIFSRQTDLGLIPNIPGEKIFLVQTADAPRLSMDHLSWSRHYRCFPGQGELPLQAFMSALKTTGYNGPLSHEIFNDVFRMGDPQRVAKDGFRSFKLLQSMINDQQPVPPPAEIQQVEFIEFTAPKQDVQPLRQLFTALGLKPVGHHPVKHAERWAVEGINLVLNHEQQGFAGEFQKVHGTGVCAFGLRVDNTYQLGKRAELLAHDLIKADPELDSHGMNHLQGVDGAYIYLLDEPLASKVWDTEFSDQQQPIESGLLTGIDHLAKSLTYQDYLSLTLQYRSLFNVETTPSFDVADPRGLIQSQVIQNPTGSFRLAMNASYSPEVTSNQFVKKYGGSGVQHIALACRDIFALAEQLANHDIQTLSIPANYYRDLDARFDLDAEHLKQLQYYNVLYDEDEQGEFWQLYIQPNRGAFFFEIIQRHGYQGIGAANAFVRTAAQRLSG